MASIRQTKNGRFEMCVRSKLLDKPVWRSFETLQMAQTYAAQLDGLLAKGVVPSELLAPV